MPFPIPVVARPLPSRPVVPPAVVPSTETAETVAPVEMRPTTPVAIDASGFFRQLHTPRVLFGHTYTLRQVVFGLLLIFCLTPWASPPVALALGLLLAQTLGNPFATQTKLATAKLLQYSVIGLGFGMNAHAAVQAGKQGIAFTVVSIFGTLVLGYFAGKWLGLTRHVTDRKSVV